MAGTLWRSYLVVMGVSIAAYFFSPPGTWTQTAWFTAIGLSAAAAILYGVVRHRPPGGAAWICFALGVGLNALGTPAEKLISLSTDDPFPSAADALYLSLYLGLGLGLIVLIRRRTAGTHHDWATMVDATTISTGLLLLSWVFFISPAASDDSLSPVGQIVSIAYPVGDIVVLSILVRLLLGSRVRRLPALGLLTASLLLFLAGDITWSVINQIDYQWEPGPALVHLLQMVFLSAYVIFGAAALHPSMREVALRVETRPARLSWPQLAVLTGASLMAPGILAIEVAGGRVTDGPAIVVGSVTLFVLVITRMAQLLHQVELQTQRLRKLARVDELTSLPNRRALAVELPTALERARRDGGPVSAAMLDLDHFKRFNDTYGHPAGDSLLKAAAAQWSGCLRSIDILVRYGGEEFLLLLPAADGDAAAEIVERLRPATPAGQTFSAGIAVWNGVETSDDLIGRADQALYEAKDQGRDRTVLDRSRSLWPVDGLCAGEAS